MPSLCTAATPSDFWASPQAFKKGPYLLSVTPGRLLSLFPSLYPTLCPQFSLSQMSSSDSLGYDRFLILGYTLPFSGSLFIPYPIFIRNKTAIKRKPFSSRLEPAPSSEPTPFVVFYLRFLTCSGRPVRHLFWGFSLDLVPMSRKSG